MDRPVRIVDTWGAVLNLIDGYMICSFALGLLPSLRHSTPEGIAFYSRGFLSTFHAPSPSSTQSIRHPHHLASCKAQCQTSEISPPTPFRSKLVFPTTHIHVFAHRAEEGNKDDDDDDDDPEPHHPDHHFTCISGKLNSYRGNSQGSRKRPQPKGRPMMNCAAAGYSTLPQQRKLRSEHLRLPCMRGVAVQYVRSRHDDDDDDEFKVLDPEQSRCEPGLDCQICSFTGRCLIENGTVAQ